MHRAIDYMEERMQVYRNTIQDHHLVVTDENCADWRKTVSDPRYKLNLVRFDNIRSSDT